MLQNTVYSMFQAVLCLLHNASNSRHLGDLHQIPCRRSPTLCQCLYRSTTDWMSERNTKRDWLMERHFLLYFEFCICYFSSAKMQWRILQQVHYIIHMELYWRLSETYVYPQRKRDTASDLWKQIFASQWYKHFNAINTGKWKCCNLLGWRQHSNIMFFFKHSPCY